MAFTAASAVGALVTDTPEATEVEAATAHVKVGEGATPGNGRFELYRAATADGRECFGIKLFNQPGAPRGVLFEGCGNPSEASIASNTGHGETIVYGRVPKSSDKVELDVPGKAKKVVKVKETTADVPQRYFVTVYSDTPRSVHAAVKDANGATLAEQDVPLPAGGGP